jgi:anti-anti-sigma factor
MPLQVNVTTKGKEGITVSPVGSIDTNTSMILEKEIDSLLKKKPKVLILDMEKVDFMSSAGVRVVFKAKRCVEAIGGVFTIVNLQPQIKKVFDIINALPSLQVFESVEELDKYLETMQKKDIEERKSS